MENARCGEIIVDLGALVRNWRHLRRLSAPAECAAVVKADAYGLGVERAAPALWDAGCRTYFVALAAEGVRLRNCLPEAAIYVLSGLPEGTEELCLRHNLRPCLASMEDVRAWAKCRSAVLSRRTAAPGRLAALLCPAALHVDTGINRVGLRFEDAHALAGERETLDSLGLSLLMSHFACADEPAHPLNAQQMARFAALRKCFPNVPASLANSAAILTRALPEQTLTRAGIALYGGQALMRGKPLEPVVTVRAKILQQIELAAGEHIGYGAAHRLEGKRRIAFVGCGYADGVPRALGACDGTKGAEIAVGNGRAAIVGRISMDQMAIDVTDLPESATRRGQLVEIIGPNAPLADIARHARTIDNEILTGLGARFHRRYLA